MDFALRCNSLKCRTQLIERAVVTTCSHVFCNPCSGSLGLTAPAGANRVCPACQTVLTQPDDAVSTSLQPTEDYKTSVLSGLSPSTIMECAGRGLAFWSYQSTQEIVYQEYLAKTLTDKYSNLNQQLDKVLNDANSELNTLNQRISNMQIEQDRLKQENTQIVAAFREKSRKQQQTQELYDRLKRKEMTAATQSAAFESVDEVLGNVSGQQCFISPQHQTPGNRARPNLQLDRNGIEKVHSHQRSGSSNSGGVLMPPPAFPRAGGLQSNAFAYTNTIPTPSDHRTQLGPTAQTSSRLSTGGYRNSASLLSKAGSSQTPSHRQPFTSLDSNAINRPSVSGYGMSAGMKSGKFASPQNAGPSQSGQSRTAHDPGPFSQVHGLSRGGGRYY